MAYEVSEMKKVFAKCQKNGCDIKVNPRPEPPKKSSTKKMRNEKRNDFRSFEFDKAYGYREKKRNGSIVG